VEVEKIAKWSSGEGRTGKRENLDERGKVERKGAIEMGQEI